MIWKNSITLLHFLTLLLKMNVNQSIAMTKEINSEEMEIFDNLFSLTGLNWTSFLG